MSNHLAQRLAAIPPGTLYAGIDLSLDRLAVELLNAAGRCLDHFQADNAPDGYAYLRQRLQRSVEKQQAAGVWVGMEPIGDRLEFPELCQAPWSIWVRAEPQQGDILARSGWGGNGVSV